MKPTSDGGPTFAVAVWLRATPVVVLLAAFVVFVVVAWPGGGGDSDEPTPTTAPSSTVCGAPDAPPDETANPQDIEAQLAAAVLREGDLPDELQRSSLIFSTNEELSQGAPDEAAELARLEELGRQLGVEVAFVPLDPGTVSSPVRGGIQNSVSAYLAAEGAGRSLQEGVAEARQNDWESLYGDLTEISVEELPRDVGDESVWFRVIGRDQGDRLVVDDQVVFRVGRARVFLRVISAFADRGPADQFAGEVEECAAIVVGRARSVFGE